MDNRDRYWLFAIPVTIGDALVSCLGVRLVHRPAPSASETTAVILSCRRVGSVACYVAIQRSTGSLIWMVLWASMQPQIDARVVLI